MNAREAKYTMEMMTYYMNNIGSHMESMSAKRSMLDKEIVDLQHELRLSPMSASDLVRHAIEERRVLRELAALKDEMRILWKFHAFAEDNKFSKENIVDCVSAMNDVVRAQDTRVYTPRIRSGLKCAGRHMG